MIRVEDRVEPDTWSCLFPSHSHCPGSRYLTHMANPSHRYPLLSWGFEG